MPENSPPRKRAAQHTGNKGRNLLSQLVGEQQAKKEAWSSTREERGISATSHGHEVLQERVWSSSYATDEIELPNYDLGSSGDHRTRPMNEENKPQPSSNNRVHRKFDSVPQIRPREPDHTTRSSDPRLQNANSCTRPSWNVFHHAQATETLDTDIYAERLRRAHSRRMARRSNPAHRDLGDADQADLGQVASGGTGSSLQDPTSLNGSSLDDSSSDDSDLEGSKQEGYIDEARKLEQRQRTLLALEGAGPPRTEELERTTERPVPPPRLRNIFGRQNRRSLIGSLAEMLDTIDDELHRALSLGRPQSAFGLASSPEPTSPGTGVQGKGTIGRPSSAQQVLSQMQADFRMNPTSVPDGLVQREWYMSMTDRIFNFGDTEEEIRQREDNRWRSRVSREADPDIAAIQIACEMTRSRRQEHRWFYTPFYGLELNEQPPNNKDAQIRDDQNLICDVDDASSVSKCSIVNTEYAKRLSRFDDDPDFRNVTDVHGDFRLPEYAKQVRSSLHDSRALPIPQSPIFPCLESAWHESDKEVQRFVYYHLTSLRWTAWDGTPIAQAWPNEVMAFCLQYQPSALSMNVAMVMADLRTSNHNREVTGGRSLLRNVVGVPQDVKRLFACIVWLQICKLRRLEDQYILTTAEIEWLYGKNPPPAPETSAEDEDPAAALEAPLPTLVQEGHKEKAYRFQRWSNAIGKLSLWLDRRLGRSKQDDSSTELPAENLDSTEQAMSENIPHNGESEAGPSAFGDSGMRPRPRLSRWSLMPFAERTISRNSHRQAKRKRLQRFTMAF